MATIIDYACLPLLVVVKTLLALLLVRLWLAMLSWVLTRSRKRHSHNKSRGSTEDVVQYKKPHQCRMRFVDNDRPSSQRMSTRIHPDPAPGSFWFVPIEPEQSVDVIPSACHQHVGVEKHYYGCYTP